MSPLFTRLRLPFLTSALLLLLVIAACVRPVPDAGEPPTVPAGDVTIPPATDPLTNTVDPTVPLTDTVQPGTVPSGTITIEDGDGTGVVQPTDPVTDTAETAPPATESETVTGPPDSVHVVQAGETLGTIAQLYGVTIEDIAAANNLDNINILSVGQELTIPEPGFAENQPAQPPATEAEGEAGEQPASTAEQVHVVRAGDTLYSIGLFYGFTVDELVAYNNLANPNALQIGDQIRIPPTE